MGFSIFTFDFASMFNNLDEFVQNNDVELPAEIMPPVSDSLLAKAEDILATSLIESEISAESLNTIIQTKTTDYVPADNFVPADNSIPETIKTEAAITTPASEIIPQSISNSEEYRKAIEALIKILQTTAVYSFQSSDVVSMKFAVNNQIDFSKQNNKEGFDKDENRFDAETDKKQVKYDQLQEELKVARLKSRIKTGYM